MVYPCQGLDELSSAPDQKLLLYPNPSAGKVFIRLTYADEGSNLIILNNLGQSLLELSCSTKEFELELPRGLYYYLYKGSFGSQQSGKVLIE